jgi:hypothetical protein
MLNLLIQAAQRRSYLNVNLIEPGKSLAIMRDFVARRTKPINPLDS